MLLGPSVTRVVTPTGGVAAATVGAPDPVVTDVVLVVSLEVLHREESAVSPVLRGSGRMVETKDRAVERAKWA